MRRLLLALSLLLTLPTAAHAVDILQGDAAAPGMHAVVHVLRDSGGFTGAEVVTTDCLEIVVGPVHVADGDGGPAPIAGGTLTTTFSIASSAAPVAWPGTTPRAWLSASASSSFSGNVNCFSSLGNSFALYCKRSA